MSGKKGSPFERKICKDLSLWWTCKESDNVFWRTSQSGGRATTRRKKGKSTRAHCGDICALDEEGAPLTKLITLELKRGYSRYTIHDILDRLARSAQQMFEAWICQAVKASKNAKSPYWMIVHKRDKKEEMVYFPNELFFKLTELSCWGTLQPPFVTIEASIKGLKDQVSVIGMKLISFLACVDPDDIRILTRKAFSASSTRT